MSDFIPVPPGQPPQQQQQPPHGRGYRGGGGRGLWRGDGNNGGRHYNNNYYQGRGRGRGPRGGGRQWGGRGGGRGRGYHRGGGGRGRGRGGGRGVGNEIFEELGSPSSSSIGIAIEGCCHGELDAIYDRVKTYEEKSGNKIEVLICCGDFQSLRTYVDFHNFACPPKYRQLGPYLKYYSGEKQAPLLTLFVGGNHENSQQLQELYYGGWVAPNIYYLGAAGVVNYKGIRIGGISGIYKSHDYKMGHFERPPYDNSTLRSVYHVRNLEVYRMKCLDAKNKVDVMISHDWPQGIEAYGNTQWLLNKKPYFRQEVQTNSLGSPANREILEALKPTLWFAAHLHVGFRATVNHSKQETQKLSLVPSQAVKKPAGGASPEKKKPEEGTTDKKEEAEGEAEPIVCQPVQQPMEETTKFISLDKCLPGKKYLSIAFVEPSSPVEKDETSPAAVNLEYDLEWLAILRKTHSLIEVEKSVQSLPEKVTPVSEEDLQWVSEKLESRAVPHNFQATVPAAPSLQQPGPLPPPLPQMGNPQTDAFLSMLELDHRVTIPYDPSCLDCIELGHDAAAAVAAAPVPDANEIDVDDVGEENVDENEIDLDDVDEDDNDGGDEEMTTDKEAAQKDDSEIALDINLEDGGEKNNDTNQSPTESDQKKPRIS